MDAGPAAVSYSAHMDEDSDAGTTVPPEAGPEHGPKRGAADAASNTPSNASPNAPPNAPAGASGGATARRDPRLVASGLLGLAWVTAPPLAGSYLLFEIGAISEFLTKDPSLGFWAYVAVFALSAGLGILPTYAQAILGGWVFGMWWGLGGALMGFTGGAAIGMLFARLVSGSSIERWIEGHQRARVIRRALVGGGPWKTFGIVSLVRLPPNSPFAITNLALGTIGVPFLLSICATFVGMLPRTAVACFFASQAAATGAEDIQALVKEQGWMTVVVGLVVMMGCVLVIGSVARRALDRVTLEDSR